MRPLMKQLASEALMHDPRIAEAKRLMLLALTDQQRRLTGVRPADPERKQSYEQTLREFAEIRGGALYYPYLGSGIGRGCLVELADGSVKYDMISGIGVHGFGHSHPALAAALFDAALADTVMQGNLQQNTDSLEFSRLLLELAQRSGGSRLSHCFLSSSGAMANENALKLVFQKKHPAGRVLAFEHAFAGRTLTLAQITDKPDYRQGLPTVLPVDFVPFFDAADPQNSATKSVAVLKQHLARFPGQHAVMCMELVQGEGGYWAGERPFFMALIEVLKQAGVAVWFDEVQTFGRTTSPFAFQTFGLAEHADVVTVGKLTQVCATLFTDDYKPKPGLISQTFTAATAAIAAGRAILQELKTGEYFGAGGKIYRLRELFVDRLHLIAERHPGWVNGPFGFGTMLAFTPFEGDPARTKSILTGLYDAGVIAFIAGSRPARIRFLPPVGAATEADVEAVCAILEDVLGKA
jgi:4-aminobutyrate aminotransferase-like enzyme